MSIFLGSSSIVTDAGALVCPRIEEGNMMKIGNQIIVHIYGGTKEDTLGSLR